MVRIKPFRGIRPPKEYASEVASRPYDVLNSAEAKAEATERSLLHIIKPEIDFDPIADEHAPEVYDKAVENFRLWRERGWLVQDPEEYYYIYAQTMDGRTQYGLTMCCHFEDYLSGAIKKHELTRTEKEEDRMIHVRNQQANIEPVFFAYPDNAEINAIVERVVTASAPEYDFTAPDGFGHKLWVIRDRATNDRITEIFRGIPALYVADGHHRTAAAARVGAECKAKNPHHTGEEEYCYFLAVTFPASQLRIIDYNRVVKDLNGLTSEDSSAASARTSSSSRRAPTSTARRRCTTSRCTSTASGTALRPSRGPTTMQTRSACSTSRFSRTGCSTASWASPTCAPRSVSTSWAASAAWAS